MVFFCEAGERGLELGACNIDCPTALLAKRVVVVRGKDFAELNLVFKPMPYAVNDTKFFVELYSAVHGGPVNVVLELVGEGANAHWPVVRKMRKYRKAAFRRTATCLFEGSFDFLYATVHPHHYSSICDTFAKK